MRVGQHHEVDVLGAKPELAIDLVGLRAATLEQAAVEQNASVLGLNDMPRASDVAADRSYELNLHATPSSFGLR